MWPNAPSIQNYPRSVHILSFAAQSSSQIEIASFIFLCSKRSAFELFEKKHQENFNPLLTQV